MKPKKGKNKKTPGKEKGLWKNPSYRNMLNPYESKYPQPSKRPDSKKKCHR